MRQRRKAIFTVRSDQMALIRFSELSPAVQTSVKPLQVATTEGRAEALTSEYAHQKIASLEVIAHGHSQVSSHHKAFLKPRDERFSLQSIPVGRVEVFGGTAAGAQIANRGAFYCRVCDCSLNDSATWVTHLNGRKHNAALGMKMQVEAATAAEVAARISWHAAQRRERRGRTDEGIVLAIEGARTAAVSAVAEERAAASTRRRVRRRAEAAAAMGLDSSDAESEDGKFHDGGSADGPAVRCRGDGSGDLASEMAAVMPGFRGLGAAKR